MDVRNGRITNNEQLHQPPWDSEAKAWWHLDALENLEEDEEPNNDDGGMPAPLQPANAHSAASPVPAIPFVTLPFDRVLSVYADLRRTTFMLYCIDHRSPCRAAEVQRWLSMQEIIQLNVQNLWGLGRGFYVVRVNDTETVERVLCNVTLPFCGSVAYALPYAPSFCPTKEPLQKCPLWVLFPHFPLFLRPFVKQIASCLGKVLYLQAEKDIDLSATPRACIYWDLSKDFPQFLWVDIRPLKPKKISVFFSPCPHLCFMCKRIGHMVVDCPLKVQERRASPSLVKVQHSSGMLMNENQLQQLKGPRNSSWMLNLNNIPVMLHSDQQSEMPCDLTCTESMPCQKSSLDHMGMQEHAVPFQKNELTHVPVTAAPLQRFGVDNSLILLDKEETSKEHRKGGVHEMRLVEDAKGTFVQSAFNGKSVEAEQHWEPEKGGQSGLEADLRKLGADSSVPRFSSEDHSETDANMNCKDAIPPDPTLKCTDLPPVPLETPGLAKRKAVSQEVKRNPPVATIKKIKMEAIEQDDHVKVSTSAMGETRETVSKGGSPRRHRVSQSSGPVTKEELKAVLQKIGPAKVDDLARQFKSRLITQEDKGSFLALVKDISCFHKTTSGSIVLRVKSQCTFCAIKG